MRKWCLLLALLPRAAWAGDFTVSPAVYERLQQAQEALSASEPKTALTRLEALARRRGLSTHERALMEQTRSRAALQSDDLPGAIEALQAALEDPEGLPEQTRRAESFNLGQLLLSADRAEEALRVFEVWVRQIEGATPEAMHVIALAYARVGRHAAALAYIEPALAARGAAAPLTWLELALLCQIERERWPEAVKLALRLTERDPTRASRWRQLSGLYARAGRSDAAVATLELALRRGLLSQPSDRRTLARHLIARGVPDAAVRILEAAPSTEKESLQLLAQAYTRARRPEKALAPLRAAAGEDGAALLRLAQLASSLRQWDEAAAAARSALKQKLETPGEALLVLGVAQLERGRPDEARRALVRAAAQASTRARAEAWLTQL